VNRNLPQGSPSIPPYGGHHHGEQSQGQAGTVAYEPTPEAPLLEGSTLPESMSQGGQGCRGAEQPQEEGQAVQSHTRVFG